MFSAVFFVALLSQWIQLDAPEELVWPIEDVSVEQVEQGLYGVSVPGFSNAAAGPVSSSIYSVSGRRITVFGNLPGSTGYNQHEWNLHHRDGDMVAAGTYIYVVS